MTARERVLAVIAKVAQDEEPQRNPDVELFKTGLLDSFAMVELMLALEEEFGIPFSPAEFDPEAWSTPNRIVTLVEERL